MQSTLLSTYRSMCALSRYDSVLPRNSEDARDGDPQTEAAIGLKRRRRDVSLCWRKWHLHL